MEPHILITGAVGSGKSTLLRRLLASCTLSVRGFRTWPSERDETGFRSFFLSPAWETSPAGTEENRVGLANGVERESYPEVFDRLGPPLLTAGPGDIVVMDELGLMEENASVFQEAVLACLNGDTPVLGAVKLRGENPFLSAVRGHPRVRLLEIHLSDRDTVYEQLLPEILRWNREE